MCSMKRETKMTWLTLEGEQTIRLWRLSGDVPPNHNKQICKMFPNNHEDENQGLDGRSYKHRVNGLDRCT